MSARERMADRIAIPHWGALLNHNGKDSNQEQWSPEMYRRADWTGTKRLLWGTVCVYGWSSVLLNCLMFIQVFWPFLDRLGCPRSVFVPLVDYNKLIVLDKKRQRNLQAIKRKMKNECTQGLYWLNHTPSHTSGQRPYVPPWFSWSEKLIRKGQSETAVPPDKEDGARSVGVGGSPAPVVSFPINSSIIRIQFPSQSPGSHGRKPGIFREMVIRIRNS